MLQVESGYVKLETPLSPMTAEVYGEWRFDDGEENRIYLPWFPSKQGLGAKGLSWSQLELRGKNFTALVS